MLASAGLDILTCLQVTLVHSCLQVTYLHLFTGNTSSCMFTSVTGSYGKMAKSGQFSFGLTAVILTFNLPNLNSSRCILNFCIFPWYCNQGPVVQSIISFMNVLVVKMLPVLVSTTSNSQLFLLKNISFLQITFFFQQKY